MHWPDLSETFEGLPWATVGAVATRLYMPERATTDLDIAVAVKDGRAARERLQKADYTYVGELAIGGSSWVSADGVDLDLIEGEETWWVEALAEAERNRDQQGLPALPLPYLVLMKLLVSRVQDAADVTRMLGVASEEAIDEIRKVVGRYAPELSEDMESFLVLGRLETQEGSQ